MLQTAERPIRLDALAIAAYEHLLEYGRRDDRHLCRRFGVEPERVNAIYRLLTELCVVEEDPGRPDSWRAVEPRLAMAKLVAPLEDEARRSAIVAEQLRTQLQSLIPVHQTVTGSRSHQHIDIIDDPAKLATVFSEKLATCRGSVYVLHPDDQQPWPFRDTAATLLTEAMARGVRLRGTLQHNARSYAPTLVEHLSSAGADLRTGVDLPAHVIVFDDDCCMVSVPGRSPDGSALPGRTTTLVIHQPLIVALLTGVCRAAWAQGAPFLAPGTDRARIAGHLRQGILQLLAGGAKDEAVARRLGLSVRTCRRHISEIMQALGADSRFQAGVEACSRGLVPAIGSSGRVRGDHGEWLGSENGAA